MEKETTNFDKNKQYTLDEAATLLPSLSTSKFTGSVDLDVVLKLKDNQKKEVIRGSINMPHSFGEEKKVIVFCEENDVNTALKAGAVKAGLDDLMKELQDGFSDFDIVLATPSVMPKIVKIGKVLGPKGLMPNPKNGTVTTDIEKTISSFKSGRVNFKSAPDQGVIRLRVAKLDMAAEQIKENLLETLKAIFNEAKKLSSNPFKKVSVKPTMGTSIKLDVNDIIKQL